MVKSNNKGFSLVEIIIAAAVFAILVYPITRALMMSVNTDNQSTKKQYAVEKAEEIMEGFKTADLSNYISIADTTKSDNRYYFKRKGADESRSLELPSGDTINYTKTTYNCDKQIAIGTGYETYDCTVEINDAAYQVMKNGYILTGLEEKSGTLEDNATFKQDGSQPLKTEISSSGIARNLDSKKVALIASATYSPNENIDEYNLDNLAYDEFLRRKGEELQNLTPEGETNIWYSQYTSGSDFFSDDYFSKNTTIKVEKKDDKYVVKCIVQYTDNTQLGVIKANYAADGNNVYYPNDDGVVYEQEFDELRPIYLLYAPAICNGSYCPTDTITLDNRLTSDKDKVSIYLIQTVSTVTDDSKNSAIDKQYRKIICDELGLSSIKDIVYTSSKTVTGFRDVKIRTDKTGECSTSNMDVYANFNIDESKSSYTDVKSMDSDDSTVVNMYDIKVTLTDSKKNKTVVTGTRGK